MSKKVEIVRGSGNVFRDFSRPNADAEQLKALLAAEIIQTLDGRRLGYQADGQQMGETPPGATPGSHRASMRRPIRPCFTAQRLSTFVGPKAAAGSYPAWPPSQTPTPS